MTTLHFSQDILKDLIEFACEAHHYDERVGLHCSHHDKCSEHQILVLNPQNVVWYQQLGMPVKKYHGNDYDNVKYIVSKNEVEQS